MMYDGAEGFATAAEILAQSGDEGCQRSAISRAYYAAYWKARQWYNINQGRGANAQVDGGHTTIWLQFSPRGMKRHTELWTTGVRLRKLREAADYEAEPPDLEYLHDKVLDAIEDSIKVRQWLDRL